MTLPKRTLRAAQLLASFGGAGFGIHLLHATEFHDHPVLVLLYGTLTAFLFYGTIASFHEALHHTLFRSGKLNAWYGKAYGVFLLLPYTAARQTHARHHVLLLRPGDWEAWPYCEPARSARFRRAFVWVDLLFGCLMGPYIYTRIYRHPDSPLNPSQRKAVRNEYLVTIACWAGAIALVNRIGAWDAFARAWLLPWWLAGVFQSGNRFLEHMGQAEHEPHGSTRSVIPGNWISTLVSRLNFQSSYQGVHHRYPHSPVVLLDLRGRRLDFPYFTSHLEALRDTFRSCVRNPGMGINARGQESVFTPVSARTPSVSR